MKVFTTICTCLELYLQYYMVCKVRELKYWHTNPYQIVSSTRRSVLNKLSRPHPVIFILDSLIFRFASTGIKGFANLQQNSLIEAQFVQVQTPSSFSDIRYTVNI